MTEPNHNPDHSHCLNLAALQSPDARDVLRLIYRRMVQGEAEYGELNLAQDSRDFLREGLEEQVDRAVYEAIHAQQRITRRDDARRRIHETVMTLTETE